VTIFLETLRDILLVPVFCGSLYCMICVWTTGRFMAHRPKINGYQPPITILKPIYGLDKGLEENVLSLCRQDYADYQIVLAVQRVDDPALPLLERLAQEFPARITLVVKPSEPVVNGKVQNLVNALAAARHDILIISDSDVRLRPDYLRTIVSPLEDSKVGYVCTLYRSVGGDRWFEKMELLSLNADFVPSIIFSAITGAAGFCLGASVAFRKADLEAVGGMGDLGHYLVEDYELGRRLRGLGKHMVLMPHLVDVVADYEDFNRWWHHQVYWDQNTWAANPVGFGLTILVRSVPFALLYAVLAGFSAWGLAVLAGALIIRLGTAAKISAHYLDDREGLRALWLLPLRDVFALASWYVALTRRSFEWRGHRFGLTREGRIVPRQTVAPGSVSS
jgi:ceramide glucosyltransferase